jgi:hypothetical protein
VGTYASGVRFRLDIVETGEQWVVTCMASHGKAVSRKPAPLSPYVRHRAAAGESKPDVKAYPGECGWRPVDSITTKQCALSLRLSGGANGA